MNLRRSEKEILNCIREGRNALVDFTENLGVPAPAANRIAEKLEQEGYLVRASYKGIARFNWFLTDKGVAELDPLSANEIRLLKEGGININQYKILAYVRTHPKAMVEEIAKKTRLNRNEIISNFCYLVDHRLLNEVGIIRWKVMISERGEKTVKLFENLIKNLT